MALRSIPIEQAVNLMELYFKAKDENRPHWMTLAFAEDAVVEMVVQTSAIAFPAKLQGREALTEALVRNFGQAYENIYSLYLDKPAGVLSGNAFECDWMVVMTEKATRNLRVGCGRYAWKFSYTDRWQVSALTITIAAMQMLPGEQMGVAMQWIGKLSYPWSTKENVLKTLPSALEIDLVRNYLQKA